MKTFKYVSQLLLVLFALTSLGFTEDTAREIDQKTNGALSVFHSEVNGAKAYLEKSKGYVVFSDVKEAGFFIGGKYGEGALRVAGETKGYYSITSASVGFQAGMQKYSLIIVFTSDHALKRFLNDDDWETDLDMNMAIADWNNDEELEDIDFGSNMVGFLFDSTGMMGNFTMEGTRFEKITPDL
ncbi:putative lipoprotein [hydrothermal vent metagenome]|uniref:Putative lipoprotein n=1 Tax=hydrothermal vent metagenome TaxID=652676 RepID=A0A1W1CAY7_9ZZZZ